MVFPAIAGRVIRGPSGPYVEYYCAISYSGNWDLILQLGLVFLVFGWSGFMALSCILTVAC